MGEGKISRKHVYYTLTSIFGWGNTVGMGEGMISRNMFTDTSCLIRLGKYCGMGSGDRMISKKHVYYALSSSWLGEYCGIG